LKIDSFFRSQTDGFLPAMTKMSHFNRLGTKSERRVKCQGRSSVEKQIKTLRLFTLDISIRRSVTLPGAVKWKERLIGAKKQVCYEQRVSLLLWTARLTANEI
jgi:hypothetical protein